MNSDLVSVIIPTYKRPHLVSRAVHSALSQTLTHLEVVVVVDGPDPEVEAVLGAIADPRLRVLVLPQNVKLAGARNAGVRAATGTWVAFLDDDDEWLPEKLERQLDLAKRSPHAYPIIATRVINRTAKGDLIWPKRFPRPDEPLSEYLFVRNSLFHGEGFILPSTYFTRRELLLNYPFEHNKHEDYDWLLRVTACEDAAVAYVPEALAIWHSHTEVGRQRLGQISNWKYSLEWIQSARDRVTPRAYAGFVITRVGSQAALERDWSAFWPLLQDVTRHGQPRLFDYLIYLGMWLVPQQTRQRLRSLITKARPAAKSASQPSNPLSTV
ncbi:MAG: glycosyltransferase family 2 protein [Synechococcales bacterium]|nr:glycosyltransferase family 2 protein [Synechococcales bacterium]